MTDNEGPHPWLRFIRADVAAAPDLLEALIDILGSLDVASRNPNIPDDTIVPVDMTMGEIRKGLAAILRATGEGERA